MNKSILAGIIALIILGSIGILLYSLDFGSENDDEIIRISTNKKQYSKSEIVEIKVKNVGTTSVHFANPEGSMVIRNIETGQYINRNTLLEGMEINFEKGREFTAIRDLRQYPDVESGFYEIEIRYQKEIDGDWEFSKHTFEII